MQIGGRTAGQPWTNPDLHGGRLSRRGALVGSPFHRRPRVQNEHGNCPHRISFTDKRLSPHAREAQYGFHTVLGAAGVSIAHTPVTIKDYAAFCTATGHNAPKVTQGDLPVTNVSLADAEAFYRWLTREDSAFTYRLPTVEEWELAA